MKQTIQLGVIISSSEGSRQVYTDDEIRKAILRKMLRQGFIGGKHTAIENLPKGLPDDKKTKNERKC